MDHTLETHCLAIRARRSFIDTFSGHFGRLADGDGAIVKVFGIHLTPAGDLLVEIARCENQPFRRMANQARRLVLPSTHDGVTVHYAYRPHRRPPP